MRYRIPQSYTHVITANALSVIVVIMALCGSVNACVSRSSSNSENASVQPLGLKWIASLVSAQRPEPMIDANSLRVVVDLFNHGRISVEDLDARAMLAGELDSRSQLEIGPIRVYPSTVEFIGVKSWQQTEESLLDSGRLTIGRAGQTSPMQFDVGQLTRQADKDDWILWNGRGLPKENADDLKPSSKPMLVKIDLADNPGMSGVWMNSTVVEEDCKFQILFRVVWKHGGESLEEVNRDRTLTGLFEIFRSKDDRKSYKSPVDLFYRFLDGPEVEPEVREQTQREIDKVRESLRAGLAEALFVRMLDLRGNDVLHQTNPVEASINTLLLASRWKLEDTNKMYRLTRDGFSFYVGRSASTHNQKSYLLYVFNSDKILQGRSEIFVKAEGIAGEVLDDTFDRVAFEFVGLNAPK
jgi:hypothetical protein